jgi:hypothetical protein
MMTRMRANNSANSLRLRRSCFKMSVYCCCRLKPGRSHQPELLDLVAYLNVTGLGCSAAGED